MLKNGTGTPTSDTPVSPEVISQLAQTDWNEEWKQLQRIRRDADDAQYWNKRSRNFNSKDAPSTYTQQFLELADIHDGEEVLDMGCGTGSIAVALAQRGCRVIAADFSQGMLDELNQRVAEAHVDTVSSLLLAWADDWDKAGLTENCVDVALASRSAATFDIGQALDKLHVAARRKCCITLPCGCSPRMDARVLDVIGVTNTHGADHQYAWNILQNKGRKPECRYIQSVRKDTFDSLEEAFEDMGRMITDTIDPADTTRISDAQNKLKEWLEQQLVANEEAGLDDGKGWKQKTLRLREPRIITWAFISWNT